MLFEFLSDFRRHRLLETECTTVLEEVSKAFGLRETPGEFEVHGLLPSGDIVLIDVARLLPLEVSYYHDDEDDGKLQVVSQSGVFRPDLMRQLSFRVPHFDAIWDQDNAVERRRLMEQVQEVLTKHMAALTHAGNV